MYVVINVMCITYVHVLYKVDNHSSYTQLHVCNYMYVINYMVTYKTPTAGSFMYM